MSSEERSGMDRLVDRVRKGLDRGRKAISKKVVPISAARLARTRAVARRQQPYLEPLEPRVLLSADLGLVPEALLAPPADTFDPRTVVEPAIHDDVLVREPSRFERIARESFVQKRVDALRGTTVAPEAEAEPEVDGGEANAPTEGATQSDPATGVVEAADAAPEDPDAAVRAMRTRVWQAEVVDGLAQSQTVDQVVVVDARIPEVDSILAALLDGLGGDASSLDAALAGDDIAVSTLDSKARAGEGVDAADPSTSAAILGDDEGLSVDVDRETRASALANALEEKGVAVVVLDAGRDGLDQLAEIARAYQGVGAMHVVSHGARGSLSLGNSRVTTETLRARAGVLAGLRVALGEEGDLLLYGCDVADGEVGIEFVSTLSELAGVDVAASNDLTGAAAFGGDWDLEVATGEIEATTIRAARFEHVLEAVTLAAPSEPTNVSVRFDPAAAEWVVEADRDLSVAGSPDATEVRLSGDGTHTVTLGDGDDSVSFFTTDDAGATGSLTVDAGAGEDQFVVQGATAPGTPGTISLEGGADGDRFDLTGLSVDPADFGITIDGGTESDTAVYASGNALDAASETSVETRLESGADVESFALSADDVRALASQMRDLATQADALESEGQFGAGLAGLSGNVDVTLGGAMDIGEVYRRIAVELEGYAASLSANTTAGTLVSELEARLSSLSDLEHFDRIVEGAVIGEGTLDASTQRYGLELKLDDDKSVKFGAAASYVLNAGSFDVVLFGGASTGNSPELTFTRESNGKATIRRSAGNWTDEGFRKGQTLVFDANSSVEDESSTTDPPSRLEQDANYSFKIDSISGDGRTITLDEGGTSDAAKKKFTDFLAEEPPTVDPGDANADPDPNGSEVRVVTRLGKNDGSDIRFRVENTLFVGSGDSFAEKGFRKGQTIDLAPSSATPEKAKIEEISEDGRVLTMSAVAGSALTTDLTALDGIEGAALTAETGSTLLVLRDRLAEAIKASDLSGRVRIVVIDTDTSGAGEAATNKSRLGIQVLDKSAGKLTYQWTGDLASVGFDQLQAPSGDAVTLTDLDGELAGLGNIGEIVLRDLEARYEAANFVPQEASDTQFDVTVVSSGADVPLGTGIFRFGFEPADPAATPAGDDVSVLIRESGTWAGLDDGTVILIEKQDALSPIAAENLGTWSVVSTNGGRLVLQRTLSVAGAGTEITREAGSWIDDGFRPGDSITVTGPGAIPTISQTTTIRRIAGDTLFLDAAIVDGALPANGDLVLTIVEDDDRTIDLRRTVGGTATESELFFDFRVAAKRVSKFSVDLGKTAEEKGLVLDATESVDLETELEAGIRLSLNKTATADANDPTTGAVESLSLVGNVNTPDVATAALPGATTAAGRDFARTVFGSNIAADKSSNIGFLGADVGTEGGYFALRARLTLNDGETWTTAGNYASDSFMSVDIPIEILPGIPGLSSSLGDPDLRVTSLQDASNSPPGGAQADLGSVFEGKDALAADALFADFDAVDKFANIDARGFVRLLGQIRTGLQRVNESEVLKKYGVPFVKKTVSTLTNIADEFGDAILFDDGDDGVDANNEKALVTGLNKQLADAGLGDYIQARTVEIDVSGEKKRGFELFSVSDKVTGFSVAIDAGDEFFGFANTLIASPGGDGFELTGTAEFAPADGRLRRALDPAPTDADADPFEARDQKATITVSLAAGNDAPDPATIELTRDDTEGNEVVGNDVVKLLDANNAPTFTTAQELSQKLIDLAIGGLPSVVSDNLEYKVVDGSELLEFTIDYETDLFEQELDIEFDLDLDPLGSIKTVGSPKLKLGGDLGFQLKVGIDLSDNPNGAGSIDGGEALTSELNDVDEITELIKLAPSITGQFLAETVEIVNEPEDVATDTFEIALDRVRMDAGTNLEFASGTLPRVSADNLVGSLMTLVAAEDETIQISQTLTDGTVRTTDGDLQNQALVVPSLSGATAPELEFFVAVARGTQSLPDNPPGQAQTAPNAAAWVKVTVAEQTFDAGASSIVRKRMYRGAVENAIAEARSASVENSITRTSSSSMTWAADGFRVGMSIEITGAGANDGFYEITELTDRKIVVGGRLSAGTTSSAQIEGSGLLQLSRSGGATKLDAFTAGTQLQITGSRRNDGTYTVLEQVAGTPTNEEQLLLVQAFDPEAASDEIELTGGGATVRLEADDTPAPAPAPGGGAGTTSTNSDAARFTLDVDGERYAIEVLAEADEADPFAPFTADNRNLNDLVQDLRVALGRATLAGVTDSPEFDLSKRIVVGLDGSQLVLTLSQTSLSQDDGEQLVQFFVNGDQGTIVRTGKGDADAGSWAADGFIAGTVIQVGSEAESNAGFYRVLEVGTADIAPEGSDDDGTAGGPSTPVELALNELRVERIDGGTITASAEALEDVTVESRIGRFTSTVAPTLGESGSGAAQRWTVTRGTADTTNLQELGFDAGQLVTIEGAGADFNGTYVVEEITDSTITLRDRTAGDALDFTRDEDSPGLVLSQTFQMVDVNVAAQSLGFGEAGRGADGASQRATLADIAIDLGNSTTLVTLDGATTMDEVRDRIEKATTGAVSADLDENESGLELRTSGVLTGTPVLTFDVDTSGASAVYTITRTTGSWEIDGFTTATGKKVEITGTNSNDGTYTIVAVDGQVLTVTQSVEQEIFVRGATAWFLDSGDSAPTTRQAFEIDSINASPSAARFGILSADAAGDVNRDGEIDGDDRDGLIEGAAIGGASLFDRIYFTPPELTIGLELSPVEPSGIDFEATFGFVEAELNLKGGFDATGVLTLNEPTTGLPSDGDGRISLREFAQGLRTPTDFIQAPRFIAGETNAGASDGTGELRASFITENSVAKGVLDRNVGSWSEDGFVVGQTLVLRNFKAGAIVLDGEYEILAVDEAAGGNLTVKDADDKFKALSTNTETWTAPTDGTQTEIISSAGILTATLTGFGTDLDPTTDALIRQLSGAVLEGEGGDPAKVVVTLFDFGDPFFRKSFGTDADQRGDVTLDALDALKVDLGNLIASPEDYDQALEVFQGATETALGAEEGIQDSLFQGDEIKVEVKYLDAAGEEKTETRKVKSDGYSRAGNEITITLEKSLVDDKGDVKEIKEITFTKPPKTQIDTPDLGNLLDFSDISVRDIIRGLQLASDFLGQFEEFAFLDEPIPVVDVSVNDLLDFADQLAAAVEEFESDPGGSLQKLESSLEEALGITEEDPFDIKLSLVTEMLPSASSASPVVAAGGGQAAAAGTADDQHKILKIDLILGDEFQESLNVDFDLSDVEGAPEGVTLAGAAGINAQGDGRIKVSLGIDISQTKMRGEPSLTFTPGTDVPPRTATISRGAAGSWIGDGFLVGHEITVKGSESGTYDGRYEILELTGSTLTVERAQTEEITGDDGETNDVAVAIEWVAGTAASGVEITAARSVSLFDETAISATFLGEADDLSFRAAVGPLGLSIQNGSAVIFGDRQDDGEFTRDSMGDIARDDIELFRAGLTFAPEDGFKARTGSSTEANSAPTSRVLATRVFDRFNNAFEVDISADTEVQLPISFPTDDQRQGTIVLVGEFDVDVDLAREDALDFAASIDVLLYRGETVVEGDEIEFSDLLSLDQFDPRELSLFDNIRLAVDGFDLLLGGVQDVLDGEILGIPLPLIGDSLSDGARFIEELREDFVEPFRDGLDDAESFVDDVEDPNKNVISQLLFDELSKTGLLLVTHDPDGNLLDNPFRARAENLVSEAMFEELAAGFPPGGWADVPVETRAFMLSQVIQLGGTRKQNGESGPEAYYDSRDPNETRGEGDGEIDISGIPSAKIRDLAFLEWDFRLGQSLAAVDADIALDFGIPAIGIEADGALGIELGWDLELGFGLDFESGLYFDIGSASELEVEVDVVLPDSLSGRLGFLQLDAENAGSGLGASFAVDLVNKGDAADERLSFAELGSLRLEAGISAEALAQLELELKLNEELLADFPPILPTIVSGFTFDWGVGGRDVGGFTFSGDTITSSAWTDAGGNQREAYDFEVGGYEAKQIISLSGDRGSDFDGRYEITGVTANTLSVKLVTSNSSAPGSDTVDFEANGTSDAWLFQIYRDIRQIDGGVFSEGLRFVGFSDVALDLGSFVNDFIAPVLGEIQKVTGPIQPIVDILTAPLPVISDLGKPTTLLDLARLTGTFNPALIEAIADIVTLVNAIPTNAETIMIPFGDFTIFERHADGTTTGIDPTDKNADVGKQSRDQGTESEKKNGKPKTSKNGKTGGFVDKLKNTKGFKFPILSDPTQVFGLLAGEEVVLFGYDMPPFELDFEYTAFFPLYGPLGIGVTGTAGAKIDFAFGYDSSGLQRFLDSGFQNPEVIFDGFFVSDNPEDVTGAGPDLNELEFDLGFFLSAELNLGVARAGVAGGVEAGIDFDLFDPNQDGKIRIGEILENVENEFLFGNPIISPLAIFDVSGVVTARAFAFLKIDLLLFEVDAEFNITPVVTLADFDVEFTRLPKLGTVLEDGTLQLNMGEFAGERLNGDLRDIGENFSLSRNGGDVRVTWKGSNPGGQDFYNDFDLADITGILAVTGEGDDTVVIAPDVILPGTNRRLRVQIDGGAGDDTITLGSATSAGTSGSSGGFTAVLRGGDGSDTIIGSAFADQIFGGAGNDDISGGGGDDVLFGDQEQIVETGPRLRNLRLSIQGNTVTALDPDVDFEAAGFRGEVGAYLGDLVKFEIFDEQGADDSVSEASYRVKAVTAPTDTAGSTLTLEIIDTSQPLPTSTDGSDRAGQEERVFTLASEGVEYVAAYKSFAGDSDGDDTISGGAGNDWILGAGGDDQLQGDADADLIFGDGGEIRLTREGAIREITGTERGLAFGADDIDGGDGTDTLYGGRGDDLIQGGDQADVIYGEAGLDRILGGDGGDTIRGGRDADLIFGDDGEDFLYGDQGADEISGGLEADFIWGDSGADLLFGDTGNDVIRGGADNDVIEGGAGADFLYGEAGDDTVFGDVATLPGDRTVRPVAAAPTFQPPTAGAGAAHRDTIEIRGGSDTVDGQFGGDKYFVKFKGGESRALTTIYDSGALDDGADSLRIIGTAADDQFLLRTSRRQDFVTPAPGATQAEIDQIEADNAIGFVASIVEDRFAAARGDGDRAFSERVDYDEVESLDVDAGYGDDRFALDDTHETTLTLFGGGGDDFFQVGQLYRSARTAADANIADRDVFHTSQTTRGFLSNGISNAATINAGNDNDTIIVFRNLGVLTVNGQAGDDLIEVRAFALVGGDPKAKDTTISGGAGVDKIRYAVNAPVNIDGGDGTDTVSVIGTEFADEFVVTKDGVFGAGLNVNFVNVELLRVDGAEGDDRFYVQSTNEQILTQIFGGLGTDTVLVGDGEQRAVTSNDLLGHSGIITHDVESQDTLYAGPNESRDGIRAPGISANVRDDEAPGILLSELGGFLRVAEGGGVVAWYDVVLTMKPEANERVTFTATAPSLSEAALARGEALITLAKADSNANSGIGTPDTSVQLTFTETGTTAWDTPQRIYVYADSDRIRATETTAAQLLDALEGTRFGVVQHKIASEIGAGSGSAGGYAGLQVPTVTVEVIDTDIADVVLSDARDLQVFERDGGADRQQVEKIYDVSLARDPRPGAGSIVVDVSVIDGASGQIELSVDGTTWTSTGLALSFSEGGTAQQVFVRGAADTLNEGFHRGLIQHTVRANANDVDDFPAAGTNGSGEIIELGTGITATDSLLLERAPVQFRGEANTNPPGIFDDETQIAGFDDVSFTVADLARAVGTSSIGDLVVRITNGTGAGQIRSVAAIVGNTVTVGAAWDTIPDETSRFSMSAITITLEQEDGPEVLSPERFDLNGSTIVFFDEDFIVEERSFLEARVTYRSLDPGYSERVDERISVSVVDEDTASIVIVESNGRTDVVEGASGDAEPTEGRVFDTYTIALSRAPESGETVRVYIDPVETETSARANAELQVQVRRPGNAPATGDPRELQFEGSGPSARAYVEFDETNWNEVRTIEVVAIDDGFEDGQETKVFAPRLRTLVDVAGPLLIDGRGGQGSLEGIGQPVLLPDLDGVVRETNLKAPTGNILDATETPDGAALVFEVDRASLERALGTSDDAAFQSALAAITNRTFEIVRGEGIDQFRLIEDARLSATNTNIVEVVVSSQLANPSWTLDLDLVDEANGSAYALTDQSLNYFAIEEEQQDVLHVSDADSPADSAGAMIALDFGVYPSMETIYNGSLLPTDEGYVVPNRITGFNMGRDTTIARGLRPGGITYTNFEGLELELGYGNNELFVDTVHERNDDVETFTRISAGRGDDVVDVSLQNGPNADGRTPWVVIDTGIGDDTLDASETNGANGIATTIPLNLIGGLGGDTLIGGNADDLIFGDFGSIDFVVPDSLGFLDDADGDGVDVGIADDAADVDARTPVEQFSVVTERIGDGGNDTLSGRAGDDRIFGGAGSDDVRGEDGQDTLFGDYGKVTRLDATRTTIETTEFFAGAADRVDGGRGNDFLLAGAAGDTLVGNFTDDLLIGEYARLNLNEGVATSIVRLGQGNLDLAAATFFGLYDPRFGPFAAFILPEQVSPAASASPVARPTVDLASSGADFDGPRLSSVLPGDNRADHPVVEGDTLWDIAEGELGDPFKWREIFDLNRETIADPDRIEPGEQIRIPVGRALTAEEIDSQRDEFAALQRRLRGIDDANAQADAEGWGFFNPIAVGAGPPARGAGTAPVEAAPPAESNEPDAATEPADDDRGAMRRGEGGEIDPATSSLILSSLVGWRKAAEPTSARGRDKWLRFDADAGRFA